MRASIIGLLLAAAALLSSCNGGQTAPEATPFDTLPMLVNSVRQCARLYSTEFKVHKIITHEDTKQLQGTFMNRPFSIDLPVGKRKIAIPMDAVVKAYIDFSNFSADNVKRDGDRLEIVLPDPQLEITSTKINHEDIKQYVALLRHNFTDEELTGYETIGRQSIVNDLPNLGIMETARLSAAKVLIPMVSEMGFGADQVTVTFRKPFTPDEISTLIETNLTGK